jgi:hypothetical protein
MRDPGGPRRESPGGPLGVLAWARVGSDDVDERHLATFGKGFRRIGSYVKLAQVGARACLDAADPARLAGARIGVFLGTGLGNTEISVPLAEGILHAERPWCSPMAFAGSVGNASAFYVARSLGVDGMNVTVSQEELSFEAALLEGVLAVGEGVVDLALVGGVDVHEPTRVAEHRARLDAVGIAGDPAAGAGWVLLGRGDASVRLAEVWLGRADLDMLLAGVPAGATVLPGWRIPGLGGDDRTGTGHGPFRVAPVESRLMAVAAAVRLVEVLDGTEPVARPGDVVHVHHTRAGTGARVRLSLA